MQQPLNGLRVVDSTNGCGELCARLLADLGADVILVEPPGGSALRSAGPTAPGGPELAHAWRNANKRGVELGADDPAFAELLATADVWIESSLPGEGLDPAAIAANNPELIVTSITPFGQTGPYVGWAANSDVLDAVSGTMFKAGMAPRHPLLPPTPMAVDYAATSAAVATALAVVQRTRSGQGQHIDLAVMTAAAAMTDWSYANASAQRTKGHPYNEVRQGGGFMYPIFACRDGYVRMVILSPRQWAALWEWMGSPEEFADPFWAQVGNRIGNMDVLNPAYERFFADKQMLDICAEGQNRGIVVTPLLTPAEVMAEPHLAARGTFVDAEPVPGHEAPIASGFLEIDGDRHGFRTSAPTLGEHQGAAFNGERTFAPPADGTPVEAPLAGMRVIDFGIGGVGVEASRLLGEYGADVIKIESRTYPDFIRLVALAETSPSFVSSSRSKRSFGCNIKTDEGLALVRRLIAGADVLVENSATGTMASLGLGYDDLRNLRDDIVMVSSQLVGSRGPNAHWTGYGPTTQTYGGLLHLWDYDDDQPPATNSTIYPDHLAGRLCALGAIASLAGRAVTGQGGHAEVAQVEVVVNMLAERLLHEAVEPGVSGPVDNTSSRHAPRGPFPCAGDESWVVIAVHHDHEWTALVNALGQPEWATDPQYATAAGRVAAKQAIEAAIAEWTSERERDDVVAALQAAGVPCAPMMTGGAMLDDPHLEARGWTISIDQPGIGPIELEGPAWVADAMGGPITFPAPGLAEHTREIATELLAMADDEIDQLVAAGVLEVENDPS